MNELNTRRNFLKFSTLAGLGISVHPLSAFSPSKEEERENDGAIETPIKPGQQVVSLLQTTDVHCQLHPHDELFWENDKAFFRKTGGYAILQRILK